MVGEYPEHDKLAKIASQSQAIGEFLNWIFSEKHWFFAYWDRKYTEPRMMQTTPNVISLLGEFFRIDLDKIESEKRTMLERLRDSNRSSA